MGNRLGGGLDVFCLDVFGFTMVKQESQGDGQMALCYSAGDGGSKGMIYSEWTCLQTLFSMVPPSQFCYWDVNADKIQWREGQTRFDLCYERPEVPTATPVQSLN